MNSTILAIDLGKFNSVFCWFDSDTRAAAFRLDFIHRVRLHSDGCGREER